MFEESDLTESKLDLKIFLRLISYIKPYVWWFALCMILLFLTVGLSLVEPLIVGKSIDRFINNYKEVYTVYDFPVKESVKFMNYYFKKEKSNNKKQKAKIYYIKEHYFIFINIDSSEIGYLDKHKFNITGQEDIIKISFNNKNLEGIKLSIKDLKILRHHDFKGLIYFGIIFFILIILTFTLNFFQNIILQILSQKIIFNMRKEIFSHIIKLNHSFFDKNPVGRLVTRVTNDTETLNEMYTSVILNLVKNLVLMFFILVMMFVINFKLTLIICVVIPFIILFTIVFRNFARANYKKMRKILAELNSFLQEHIFGMKIIQLFNMETKKLLQFKNVSKKLYKSYFREIIIFSLFRPSTYFLYGAAICLIMLFGGKNVLYGTLTFGTLFIFIHYIQLFFQPIQELAEQFNVLQSAIASSERFFLLLQDKSIISNKKKAIKIDKIKGNIKFKNVWFSYNNKEWILKNISFNIKEGEKIALVGHTGSGKSTIINLLGRYYEIKKGKITIDGNNIKDIDLDCLRKNIGLVMQDVFIFTGSIKNNISLLNENITDEQIKNSSCFVNADKFINKYKDKYFHHISERGTTLSTGQRQLLSFARAISFNPSILVLDEATSNIDTETEFLIQDALVKILKNKTSIVVAHRLSTIKNCDKIIVLHKGKIKEIGNHKTLIRKKGIYYNLYKLNYDLD